MFHDNVYESIHSHWIKDQNHPHRGQRKRAIPELTDISKLIDVAFIASLRKEEKEYFNFSLVLFPEESEDKETEQSKLKLEIIPFDQKLTFNSCLMEYGDVISDNEGYAIDQTHITIQSTSKKGTAYCKVEIVDYKGTYKVLFSVAPKK